MAETPGRLQEKLDLPPPDLSESTCRVVGSPRKVVHALRPLIGAGVQFFIFVAADLDSARLLGERVIPEVEQLPGATTVATGGERCSSSGVGGGGDVYLSPKSRAGGDQTSGAPPLAEAVGKATLPCVGRIL